RHLHFRFLFYFSAAPRDLHSFPTRRSSDLLGRLGTLSQIRRLLQRARRGERGRGAARRALPALEETDRRRGARRHRLGRDVPHRSEEHTSELQSPYDLVCRLLLEKKNKRIN